MVYLESHVTKSAADAAAPETTAPITEKDADSQSNRIVFLYKARRGIAKQSYGLNVALLAGLPSDVVETAARAAAGFSESRGAAEQAANTLRKVIAALESSSDADAAECLKESRSCSSACAKTNT
jgi:DNA mismatch repair ATPase MutS